MIDTESLLKMSETMGQFVELVAGYRQQLEQAGFSPNAAELMASDYHRGLVAGIFGQLANDE